MGEPSRGERDPAARRPVDACQACSLAWVGIGRSTATNGLQEALEHAAANRMLELAHRLGLDLPDAFPRDTEDLADLLEGVGVAIPETVAQLDDLALAIGQRAEHLIELLLEHLVGRRVDRTLGGAVLDEIAEEAIVRVADGAIERDG